MPQSLFFFSNDKKENAKETFAVVMRYFVMVMSLGFVFIMAYLDIFKYFIDEKFWEGLHIVPILLLANVFLGINTNLSFWYKLSDKTNYAILITGFGLVLTLAVNIWLIPRIGYEGAAWATLASYVGMTVLSYLLGQQNISNTLSNRANPYWWFLSRLSLPGLPTISL